jgi:hypothetical protein
MMSDYNDAIAAMIIVAGGIVPESSFIAIRDSADRALKHWIQDIVNQPIRKSALIADFNAPLYERRNHTRIQGPAFHRLPVENLEPFKDGKK